MRIEDNLAAVNLDAVHNDEMCKYKFSQNRLSRASEHAIVDGVPNSLSGTQTAIVEGLTDFPHSEM
jgi:hypothetical protein